MISRLAMAGAVGATMFALAGAGAAALNAGGTDGVVQQTNALTATCQPNNIEFQNVVNKADVPYTNISQQNVDAQCGGQTLQVALKMDNGAVAYSTKVLIPTSNFTNDTWVQYLGLGPNPGQYGDAPYGIDLKPMYASGVCAQHVVSTIVTVANTIASPGSMTAPAVTGNLPSCANEAVFQQPSA